MGLRPRDFKSLVYTNSTTSAYFRNLRPRLAGRKGLASPLVKESDEERGAQKDEKPMAIESREIEFTEIARRVSDLIDKYGQG